MNASEATTGIEPCHRRRWPHRRRRPAGIGCRRCGREDRRAPADGDPVRSRRPSSDTGSGRSPSVRSQCQPLAAPSTATGRPAGVAALRRPSPRARCISAEPNIGIEARRGDRQLHAHDGEGRRRRPPGRRRGPPGPRRAAGSAPDSEPSARPRSGTGARRRRAGRPRRSGPAHPGGSGTVPVALAGRLVRRRRLELRRDVDGEALRAVRDRHRRAPRRRPSPARPARRSVAPAAEPRRRSRRATAASPAGSTPTSVPERIVRPRSKDTVATGVAAATPGIAR